jgi:hypothetical protein
MKDITTKDFASHPIHDWLKKIRLHYVPGQRTPLLEQFISGLLTHFEAAGNVVQPSADANTDVLLTTATFGQVINWRRSLMLTGRIQLKLEHTPVTVTVIHITPQQLEEQLAYFERVLAKQPPDPDDFRFEGLADTAPAVLIEQGKRGGPILSLLRVLQAQSKCIRILLLVGDEQIEYVYHFDLVGAHPVSRYSAGEQAFYDDIVLRLVTYESTHEITNHQTVGDPIARRTWDGLPAVSGMKQAGLELGKRGFFTDMIRISDLTNVPAVTDAISSQYSEGCFATWEPQIPALIATITGSARPVDKGNITDDDLAVIVAVRPDGQGVQVRHVADKDNIKPSSEAVEMIDMDSLLPRVTLEDGTEVPVARSKLHGHRGVSSYNPQKVEFVPLDPPYYHYLVSCATEAQARGIKAAFGRAESLLNPDDPRQLAFTVLPGHGVVIAEKWQAGKAPFQVIWEYMDSGDLVIDKLIPQGPMAYTEVNGQMVLQK